VLCSPAERTRETLALVRPALAGSAVSLEDDLYGASSDRLLERLRIVPQGVASVMLIGHNPGLHDLAVGLAAAGPELERLEAKFPTAALATLKLEGTTWSELKEGDGELVAYVVPKELG
jgi:phosphohistidine phosphatase